MHAVAQAAGPGARVIYADIDPVAIAAAAAAAHSKALLSRRPVPRSSTLTCATRRGSWATG